MKHIFALIILIGFYSDSFSQKFGEKDLYGNWRVEEIIEKPTNPQFVPLISGFENSTFIFKQNGDFVLNATSKSELFGMIIKMTKGTKWIFEKGKQFVKIGNKDNGYSVMGIEISEVNGVKIFYLDESGIKLKMNKTE